MQFSYVLSCTAIVGAVTAVPLAELERRYKDTPMEKWTMPGLGERALVPRMPSGRHRSSTIKPIKPPRLARNQARPEEEYPYDLAIEWADAYPKGTGWPRSTWRDRTPEDEDDALYYRGKDQFDRDLVEMYVGKRQPFTEQNARDVINEYPIYKDAYLGSRDTKGSRKYTINDIRKTPLYATGTDKDEFPSISRAYPEGAFGVGRVPRVESKYQSQMLTEAERAYPGSRLLVVPNYKNNPMSDRPLLRGPSGPNDRTPYPVPRVPDSTMQAYLEPMSVPVRGRPKGHRRSASPVLMSTAPLVRTRSVGPSRRSRRIIYDSEDEYDDYKRKRDLGSAGLGENAASDLGERDIIGQIGGQEQNATSTTTADLQDMVGAWLSAFDDARENATALLQPFIVDLLNGTNTPLGEAMAWGLYSMTLPAVAVTGPFLGNYSAFGSTGAANETSLVPSGDDWSSWSNEVHNFYLDYYNLAYNAVNETGLLRDLESLAGAIASVNSTMLPEDETTIMDHTIEPFIPFLQSMYDYNGFDFTPSNSSSSSSNNTDMYTVDDPNMSINFVPPSDPSGVFIFGYSDGAANMTQLEQTAKALNLTIDFPTNGSSPLHNATMQNYTMQRRSIKVLTLV